MTRDPDVPRLQLLPLIALQLSHPHPYPHSLPPSRFSDWTLFTISCIIALIRTPFLLLLLKTAPSHLFIPLHNYFRFLSYSFPHLHCSTSFPIYTTHLALEALGHIISPLLCHQSLLQSCYRATTFAVQTPTCLISSSTDL
jgi:hypothetical protein